MTSNPSTTCNVSCVANNHDVSAEVPSQEQHQKASDVVYVHNEKSVQNDVGEIDVSVSVANLVLMDEEHNSSSNTDGDGTTGHTIAFKSEEIPLTHYGILEKAP